jgi:hypothetical protein
MTPTRQISDRNQLRMIRDVLLNANGNVRMQSPNSPNKNIKKSVKRSAKPKKSEKNLERG